VVDASDEDFPLTEAVATELDRRVAEADANPESGATWDEVYTRITDPARRHPTQVTRTR
jgi:putative addiction module component (TIGR02574 family)